MKDPTTYEHVAPELVGNRRTILVSDQAGKSNVVDRLTSAGIAFDAADPAIEHILREVKQKNPKATAMTGLARRLNCSRCAIWGSCRNFSEVEAYEVNVSNDRTHGTRSVAKLALVIDGETVETQGAGNGPINALDMALRLICAAMPFI
ncbi:MAG: hypothetical protein CM15mP21_1690 [Hyphomicrobiales bacterium]|nr:MAG: hypothetical protein CM15mP21_1690 [Hyphomicrobiales bacterium]